MAYFDWKDEYSVHIGVIDNQHRHLVELLNTLFTAMHEKKANSVCGSILDSLIEYAGYHFAEEEALMKAHAYPGYYLHLREHMELTQQVLNYKREFRDGALVAVELSGFLKDWLITHILESDMKFGAFLKGKGIQ